jgi:hypothetical protein
MVFVILGCKSSFHQSQNKNLYQVYKLDSINDFYLIYAKKGDSLFKIISKRELVKHMKKIEINETYPFKLHSRRESLPTIDGIKLEPINYLDVECFAFDKETTICIERNNGIYDLYFAENIKGLFFINN